jgi:hypothetical protein
MRVAQVNVQREHAALLVHTRVEAAVSIFGTTPRIAEDVNCLADPASTAVTAGAMIAVLRILDSEFAQTNAMVIKDNFSVMIYRMIGRTVGAVVPHAVLTSVAPALVCPDGDAASGCECYECIWPFCS